jgi:hypothetical protein
MKTLNISEDAFIKLLCIREKRPQDRSRAETLDYVLRVFEESPLRIKAPGSASPIIDADNLRIVTPSTLADKLTRDALKTTSNAIRKAYPSEESKE